MRSDQHRQAALLFAVPLWALGGCLVPGETDEPTAAVYVFKLPQMDLPATAMLSEADQVGLGIAEREFEIEEGAGRVQFRFETIEQFDEGLVSDEYCLVDDIVVVDGRTGDETVGIEAGECLYQQYEHPDLD